MLTQQEIINNLQKLFALEEYTTAAEIIAKVRQIPKLYNDTIAIYDANLCLMHSDYNAMWDAIQKGLSYNCKNSELYLLLGEYYLPKNANQAYLCFENALYHCENEEDRTVIQSYLQSLKEQYPVTVNKTSFIILSYNLLNYTRDCIESIRATVPEYAREIIVVDNASVDDSVAWLREQPDIILRENKENSGFPKGCNEGIELANKENDIFLLNNDTLMTENALFWLRMGLYENDSVGTTGSVSNCVSNLQDIHLSDSSTDFLLNFGAQNNIPAKYPYEEKLFLIGFALLIKRTVINKLGVLDERFSPGNCEDTDYCLRVLTAGYKNILCKNSFIIHFGHKSFEKNKTNYTNLLQVNREKFKNKWGFDELYYLYPRQELVNLIEEHQENPLTILDIGCGCGATSAYIKGRYPHSTAYGVEIVPDIANIATHSLHAICANIETLDFPWPENFFDYVIMGDVLEHLHNPSAVLEKLYKHVKTGGHIIVSMPNMKHYSVMLPLLIDDEFTYQDSGILDTTHVKMYTGTEMLRLVRQSGYTVEHFAYTTIEEPNAGAMKFIDLLVSMSKTKNKTEYLAFQYIIKAKKADNTKPILGEHHAN